MDDSLAALALGSPSKPRRTLNPRETKTAAARNPRAMPTKGTHVRFSASSESDGDSSGDDDERSGHDARARANANASSSSDDPVPTPTPHTPSPAATANANADADADGENREEEGIPRPPRPTTTEPARTSASGMRAWLNELKDLRRALKKDRINDERARRATDDAITVHLARADEVLRELIDRRNRLQNEASSAAAARGGDHEMRRLQLFDADAFVILSEILEYQTRKFFDPLCVVSAGMVARYVAAKFPGNAPQRGGDVLGDAREDVDWDAMGAKLWNIGAHLGGGVRLRALGNSMVGSGAFAGGVDRRIAEERGPGGKVGRVGGGGGWRTNDHDRGRARNKKGATAPVSRPATLKNAADATEGQPGGARSEANERLERLARTLETDGAADLAKHFFDATSFSKSVEKLLDVATLVAGGNAAIAPVDEKEEGEGGEDDDEDEDEDDAGARLKTGCELSIAEATPRLDDNPDDNHAFVFQFDLKTWRAMGGREDDDANRDADAAAADGGGAKKSKYYGNGLFGGGLPEDAYVMPVNADPYEAMLDGDPARSRAALDTLRLSDRDRVVCAGIAYIYREAFLGETFFRAWGSDVVGVFHAFSVAAPGGPVKELSTRAARAVADHWLQCNHEMPVGATSEDVIFFNQGSFVLSRMGIEHGALKSQILSHAVRFDSRWYLGLDLNDPATYQNNCGDACWKKLTNALICSFFLEGNGVEPEIRGDTATDVKRHCERRDDGEINAREEWDYGDRDARESPEFEAQCYFVTHKVFTATDWCRRKLKPEQWRRERDFLLRHLTHTWKVMRDVHLCGEFVQTLRCFGDKESNNAEIKAAVAFIVRSQDQSTGGWEVRAADFKNAYHATVCAVGALICPLMGDAADKVTPLEADVDRGSKRQRAAAAARAKEAADKRATSRGAEKDPPARATTYSWESGADETATRDVEPPRKRRGRPIESERTNETNERNATLD